MDFNRFVGLPWKTGGRSFDGVDCYGLVWLFFREERGLTLRSYEEAYCDATDTEHTSSLIYAGIEAWREVEPEPGAVILMRRGRYPAHVGILVKGRHILHIEQERTLSCTVRITDEMRARILGYFLPRD